MIRNPILPGFNPDPSLVRAGEDYYIATSTFAWQPGIRLFHSRDLATMVGLACVDAYRKDLLAHFDWFDLRHGPAARMSSPARAVTSSSSGGAAGAGGGSAQAAVDVEALARDHA